MTSFTRIGLHFLCLAVVLHLRLSMLHAQEAPLTMSDPAQPAPQDNEGIAFNVYVPKTSVALEVSASLLYLQPGGNMHYGTLVNPFPFLQPHWSDQAVNPGFTPAFNLGTRYSFDGGGAITLDWTHFNSYDNEWQRRPCLTRRVDIDGPGQHAALGPRF